MEEADRTLVAALLAKALIDADATLDRRFLTEPGLHAEEKMALRTETYVAVIKLWMGTGWKPTVS